jgi:alpha-tubulin suppressor-like RCC1 family protein
MLRSIALLAALAFCAIAGTAVADSANSVTHEAAHAKLDSGSQHTCAVLGAGAVRCWGLGDNGQLGLASTASIGDDEHPALVGAVNLGVAATAVTAGGRHSCAILTGGSVRCWGDGVYGALGNGLSDDIGDDEQPSTAPVVNLGAGRTATQIAAGSSHTCALLDNATVRCWGRNSDGQLGYGDRDARFEPSTTAVSFGAGLTAVAIAAGGNHSCAILSNGSLSCWGDGQYGALGTGVDENDRLTPTPVAIGGDVTAIDVGSGHGCAIMATTNALRCWGFGEYGQLGYGDTKTVGDNETPSSKGNISLGAGRTARSVTVAAFSTCAQLDTGALRCFGDGSWGELGFGKADDIGDDELPSTAPLTTAPAGRTFTATSGGGSFRCFSFDDASIRCAGATDDGETAEPDEWSGGLIDVADAPLTGVRAIRFTGGGSDLRLRFQHQYDGEIGVGEDRTIELHINNAGPQATTGQSVTIYTPSGLTVISATPSHGTYANGLWSMAGSAMQPTAKRTITLVVRGKTVGSHTIEASIGSQTGPADVDSNPGYPSYDEDDSAKDTTKVVPSADLSVSTAVSTAELPAKGQRSMVVTVSNAGPHAATNVEVGTTGAFGGGAWSTVSSSASLGTTAGGTWKIPTLAANASATMTVTVTTAQIGTKELGAKITDADQPDVDLTDRQSKKAIPVVAAADLMLQWSHPGHKIYPGDQATFTLRTYNEGTATASARYLITAPAGLTVTGASGTGVTWDADKSMATIAALAGGAQHTIAVKVTGTAVGDHPLTAEVAASTKLDPDSTPGKGIGEDDSASTAMSVIARYVAPPKATPPASTPPATMPGRSSQSTSARIIPGPAPLNVQGLAISVKKRIASATFRADGRGKAFLWVLRKTGSRWQVVKRIPNVQLAPKRLVVKLGKLKPGSYKVTLAPERGRQVNKTFRVR